MRKKIITVFILFALTIGMSMPLSAVMDYRQEMIDYVSGISQYAKDIDPTFAVIPQNGADLVATNPTMYLGAIDAIGQEDFLYGYIRDNQKTPIKETNYIKKYLDIYKANGKAVLITDYCSTQSKMALSYTTNQSYGYVSFAANKRDLNNIPKYPTTPNNVNANNITEIADAKNFLYLIDPGNYSNKAAFLSALKKTNYDVILVDLFFDDVQLTASDVASLKVKANGGSRLVICYMSIGEAENYRYYWQKIWKTQKPSWLLKQNPDWAGCYLVQYWNPEWQSIIYGNNNSYLYKIVNAGFDGVYLDLIDAYESFE
jgi:cysteinyl-tRNA synthetase, unknown class